MKKIFKYFNTVKKELILVPILVMIEVMFEILIPVFMSRLIDLGIKADGGPYLNTIYLYGGLMAASAVIALIFGILVTRTTAKVSTEFGHNLREAQFAKIQEYSFENIDNFKTSSLITRITMDVNMIQQSANMILRIGLRAPAIIIFSIVSILLFAPSLSIIFIVIGPIMILAILFMMKKAHPYFVEMFSRIDNLNQVIQEDLIAVRTVKSFVREEHEINRFNNSTNNLREVATKAEKIIIFNHPIMQLTLSITFVLIGWFGSKMMVVGGLTEGEFANTVTYINQILFSLMMLSQVFLMIVISRASVERIVDVLEEEPLLKECTHPDDLISDGSFAFENVTFRYANSSKKILDNMSFNVESGSFVGIFGATGTGKSTIVQLLSRLYDTSQGTVYIGGKDIKNYSLESLRKDVILVLQNNVLFSGSVRDNIKWGKKDATDDEIIKALKQAQAYDFVMNMDKGIDSWIEQGGVNVSGGQRQRLTIARALIANPKILILDDSMSAVDTKTESLIRKAFNEHAPEMTKVVISQRLSSIEDADKIIILDEEGISVIGKHDDLYETNEMYKTIYDVQGKQREAKQ